MWGGGGVWQCKTPLQRKWVKKHMLLGNCWNIALLNQNILSWTINSGVAQQCWRNAVPFTQIPLPRLTHWQAPDVSMEKDLREASHRLQCLCVVLVCRGVFRQKGKQCFRLMLLTLVWPQDHLCEFTLGVRVWLQYNLPQIARIPDCKLAISCWAMTGTKGVFVFNSASNSTQYLPESPDFCMYQNAQRVRLWCAGTHF